jgi:8-oxo-dGTP diphosphatase
MTQVTEVAAAVMLRGDPAAPEFLLAQRPPGKVYAGYWEFPGGKVEPGETARAALVRELQEELGITVEQAWPWVCCEFSYPHATVRLRFFRVNRWHGELAAIEHSGLIWLQSGVAASVAPILPANDPILRALALPSLYALSNAEESGVAVELARLQNALANGLRLFQVRDKTLPPTQRHAFARQVMALAARHEQVMVLINDDQELARRVGAGGRSPFVAATLADRTAPGFCLRRRLVPRPCGPGSRRRTGTRFRRPRPLAADGQPPRSRRHRLDQRSRASSNARPCRSTRSAACSPRRSTLARQPRRDTASRCCAAGARVVG